MKDSPGFPFVGAVFDGNLDLFGDTEGTQVNPFGRGSEKVISRISAGEIREIFVCNIFHLVGFVTGKPSETPFLTIEISFINGSV